MIHRHGVNGPRDEVEFEHGSSLDPAEPTARLYYLLTVSIINKGDMSEFVKTLWIEDADRTVGLDLTNALSGEAELKPRARIAVPVDAATLPESQGGFVAIVRLTSGPEIISGVEHLIDGLIDDADDTTPVAMSRQQK